MAKGRELLTQRLKASDAQIKAFLARLDRFLNRNLTEIVGNLEIGEEGARDVAQVLGSLQTTLIEAGLAEEIGELQAIYRDELGYINRSLRSAGIPAQFGDTDIDVINTLIDFDTEQVFGMVSGYVDDVKSTIMRAVLVGDVPDFNAIADEQGGRLISNLETEMLTALLGFSRTVTVNKSVELGFSLFEYLGPEDEITRDFCAGVLEDRDPPIYTIQEIQDMDNDQGLPVFAYGGGYNCRHQWRPISLERAVEEGYENAN